MGVIGTIVKKINKKIHCNFAEIVFKLNSNLHEYDYWDMAFKRQFQQYICYPVLYSDLWMEEHEIYVYS